MRRCLITTLLIIAGQQLRAQDTLVKRNGDRLVVKVIEINPTSILYRRFDYPDEPVYTILKQEISEIVYLNGLRKVLSDSLQTKKIHIQHSELSLINKGRAFYYQGKRIKEAEMVSVVNKLSSKSLNAMGKKIERLRFAQNIGTFCSATCFVYGFYTFQINGVKPVWIPGNRPRLSGGDVRVHNRGNLLMLAGVISAAITFKCAFERRKHDRLIVDAYNQHIAK